MPAYISHAIMGEEVLKKLKSEHILRIPIDFESMKTFSLGADLSNLSKISGYASHNKDTQLFFLTMIDYIKQQNLKENVQIISLLYGHISHYFMDINCHPLIYYNEVGLNNVTLISNHSLVEGYIDSYLCKKILHKDIMKVNSSYFNKGQINYLENVILLNYVYQKVYNDPKIINSYNAIIKVFSLLENVSKSGLFSKSNLEKISGFEKFLSLNQINRLDFINLDNKEWTNPVSGEKYYKSFMQLYEQSIIEALYAINNVNKYLYDGCSCDELLKIFTDLSYDTGMNCSFGHKMQFVRKLNS